MFKQIRQLCTPAKFYFIISVLSLLFMIISNIGNSKIFCMGNYECPVNNVYWIYIIKIIYLVITTIVLESLCKNGYSGLSWFLVFFPIIFYFIALGFFMINQQSSIIIINQQEYM